MIKIKCSFSVIKFAVLLLATQISFSPLFSSAFGAAIDDELAKKVNPSAHPQSSSDEAVRKIGELINILFPVFQGAGLILLIIGLGQFILSFKDESNESKVKSTMLISIAACLVGLPFLIKGMLAAAGVTPF